MSSLHNFGVSVLHAFKPRSRSHGSEHKRSQSSEKTQEKQRNRSRSFDRKRSLGIVNLVSMSGHSSRKEKFVSPEAYGKSASSDDLLGENVSTDLHDFKNTEDQNPTGIETNDTIDSQDPGSGKAKMDRSESFRPRSGSAGKKRSRFYIVRRSRSFHLGWGNKENKAINKPSHEQFNSAENIIEEVYTEKQNSNVVKNDSMGFTGGNNVVDSDSCAGNDSNTSEDAVKLAQELGGENSSAQSNNDGQIKQNSNNSKDALDIESLFSPAEEHNNKCGIDNNREESGKNPSVIAALSDGGDITESCLVREISASVSPSTCNVEAELLTGTELQEGLIPLVESQELQPKQDTQAEDSKEEPVLVFGGEIKEKELSTSPDATSDSSDVKQEESDSKHIKSGTAILETTEADITEEERVMLTNDSNNSEPTSPVSPTKEGGSVKSKQKKKRKTSIFDFLFHRHQKTVKKDDGIEEDPAKGVDEDDEESGGQPDQEDGTESGLEQEVLGLESESNKEDQESFRTGEEESNMLEKSECLETNMDNELFIEEETEKKGLDDVCKEDYEQEERLQEFIDQVENPEVCMLHAVIQM